MVLHQRFNMINSILTSPHSDHYSNKCRKQRLGAVEIRDLDSDKISKDFLSSDFRMTLMTILDLVCSQNPTIVNPDDIHNSDSKRVAIIIPKSPPSKRVKSDHDNSTHSPGQSLIAPGTSSTGVASVESTTSCDEQYTRFLMNTFVYDVLSCLKEESSTLS